MVKAVLFDYSVLMNYQAVMARAVAQVFSEYDSWPSEKDIVLQNLIWDKNHLQRIFKAHHFWDEKPPMTDECYRRVQERHQALEQKDLTITAGLDEVLDLLRNHSIPFGVVSVSPRGDIERQLELTGLYDHFYPHIYTREMAEPSTPAPDLYELATRGLEVSGTEEYVMIHGSAAQGFVIGLTGVCRDNDGHEHIFIGDDGISIPLPTMAAVRMELTNLLNPPAPGSSFRSEKRGFPEFRPS